MKHNGETIAPVNTFAIPNCVLVFPTKPGLLRAHARTHTRAHLCTPDIGGLMRSANDKSRCDRASDLEYENDSGCDKLSYPPFLHDVSAVFTVDIRLCNSVGNDFQQMLRWFVSSAY